MTIGQQIKLARELKGIQILEVSQQLRIAVKVLESIEQDQQPEGVPSTIYQGFVRSYCKFLKIKPTPIKAEVVEIPIVTAPANLAPVVESFKEVPKSDQKSVENKSKNKEVYHDEHKVSPWRWGTVVGVLLISALGLKMYQRYQSELYQPPEVQSDEKVEVQQLDPLIEQVVEATGSELSVQPRSEMAAESTTPASEVIVAEPNGPKEESTTVTQAQPFIETNQKPLMLKANGKSFNEVIIEAKKESQVRLLSAAKQTEAKMMLPGRFYVFREKGTFKLEATDSSGVVITLNGRIIHQPNEESQPLKIEVKE